MPSCHMIWALFISLTCMLSDPKSSIPSENITERCSVKQFIWKNTATRFIVHTRTTWYLFILSTTHSTRAVWYAFVWIYVQICYTLYHSMAGDGLRNEREWAFDTRINCTPIDITLCIQITKKYSIVVMCTIIGVSDDIIGPITCGISYHNPFNSLYIVCN